MAGIPWPTPSTITDDLATAESISGARPVYITYSGLLAIAYAGSGLQMPAVGVCNGSWDSGQVATFVRNGRTFFPFGVDQKWSGKVGRALYVGSGELVPASDLLSGMIWQRIGIGVERGVAVQLSPYEVPPSGGVLSGTLAFNAVFSGNIASGVVCSNHLASGLVSALGAVALQSGQVSSGFVGNAAVLSGSVGSGQLASGHMAPGFITGLGAVSLTSGQVTSGLIGNAAVLSGSLGSGQIASGHLAAGLLANISSPLVSGQVASGFIANAAVVSGSIASGNIGGVHLASGTVGPESIATAAIVSGKVGSGQVGHTHLCSGAARSGHIGDVAINSGNVASGAISATHMSSGAIRSGHVGDGAVTSGGIASGTNCSYAGAVKMSLVTAETISGQIAVAFSTLGGPTIVRAERASGLRLPAIGVTVSGALSGIVCEVVAFGYLPCPASGMVASGFPGNLLYVGSGGLLVNRSGFMAGASSGAPFLSGNSQQAIGTSLSGAIFVKPSDFLGRSGFYQTLPYLV